VYRFHQAEIDAIPNEKDRLNRLIELNVVEQVHNLAKTSIVQHAWKTRNAPHIHGWVYDLSDGLIKTLFEMPANTVLDHHIYEYDFTDL
jgi:carbonic anhydrase